MQFPVNSSALLDELDRIYPEYIPEATATPAEIQRGLGRREVVLFLKQWRDKDARQLERKRLSRV